MNYIVYCWCCQFAYTHGTSMRRFSIIVVTQCECLHSSCQEPGSYFHWLSSWKKSYFTNLIELTTIQATSRNANQFWDKAFTTVEHNWYSAIDVFVKTWECPFRTNETIRTNDRPPPYYLTKHLRKVLCPLRILLVNKCHPMTDTSGPGF